MAQPNKTGQPLQQPANQRQDNAQFAASRSAMTQNQPQQMPANQRQGHAQFAASSSAMTKNQPQQMSANQLQGNALTQNWNQKSKRRFYVDVKFRLAANLFFFNLIK